MGTNPNPLAKKYLDEGGELFEQNRHMEAIERLTKAIEIDGEYSSAYFNRALCYASLGLYDQATKDVEAVLRLEPDCHDGPYLLGMICEYQRNYEKAIQWYNESLSKKTDYSAARERLENLKVRVQPNLESFTETIGIGSEDELASPIYDLKDFAKAGLGQRKLGETRIVDGQIKGIALTRPMRKMEDIVGLEEVKRALELSVIGPAKRPGGMKRWNLESGLSVLLYGPTGCGKTYLVEALAGEIEACILVLNLNEVLDMYSGNTEKNIHTVFRQARELVTKGGATHVVIFIDELDALGMSRALDRDSPGKRAAVNQLLMELDGVDRNPEGLIIVGATNRPWDIDPALVRAGRFGDEWYVAVPSSQERSSLFELYLKGVPTEHVDYGRLADMTSAYSPADIKKVVRMAKLRAMERENISGKETVLSTNDVEDVIRGNQTSSLRSWFLTTAEEFASKHLDRTKYKRMLEDMVTVLGNEDRLTQSEGIEHSLLPGIRGKQTVSAYA